MDAQDESGRERLIELERRRRARGIALTVQVWWDDGGIRYNRPRSITLREEDRLFDVLSRLVPCEFWGSLMYETGEVWYRRLPADEATPQNRWAAWTEDSPYEAAEYVDRRQVYIRTWHDHGAEIPTILLEDIRDIETPRAAEARRAAWRQYEAEEAAERLGQMQGLLADP
jgi:hypothetical protein